MSAKAKAKAKAKVGRFIMNTEVEKFLKKTNPWQDIMVELRLILLKTKLIEEFKWRLPCYSYKGNNVVIIQPFKACLGLMFFKGTLLKDPQKILVENGPNSQASRRLEFRSVEELTQHASVIKSYIKEAIAIEESGQKIEFKKKPESLPEELKDIFTKNPKLKTAFNSLTPGRQRAYILHFSSAKQASTRVSRIKKYIPQILKGKGLSDG